MKSVLFIAYNFPPAGGAGVQRSLKFVKYLPQFGWQPVVVTTTPEAYPFLDKSLSADIPLGTHIHRVRSLDINGLRPLLTRLKLEKFVTAANVALQLPDAALLWSYLARFIISRLAQQHQPSLIYSSSGPASAHLLGMWAKRELELPWVADFRDPWSESRRVPYPPGYRLINRRLEHRVLTTADRVVTISEPLAKDLHRLSGYRQSGIVIENGYDEDDVPAHPPCPTARFTISYTGTFSHLRRPDAFLDAVEHLIASDQIPLAQIRVLVAGNNTERYIPSRPPFERVGYIDHAALSSLRRESDVLLLIQDPAPENRGAYSGKLFEYLGSNRPTLAIGHPGSVAAQLIRSTQAGVATTHDPSEIAAAILEFYQAWKAGRFEHSPRWEIIQQYTRRNLTARLAAEFDRLVAEAAA
jgi:glycosyltransferase involved in cell wall biosynthesis